MSVGTGATPKSRRAALLFGAAVLAAAAALLFFFKFGKAQGSVAVLRYGSPEQTMDIPLNTDKTYDVDTGAYTIHLQVADGTIAFVDSPCPDHTCESFGKLKNVGDWAACLPAQATLTIEEKTA